MKNLFFASLVLAFFVSLFLGTEAARNAGVAPLVGAGAFLSVVAFVTYHVLVVLYQDYKALHKVTK